MSNVLDKYVFQALDAYPYNLEDTITSLHYALSYDENNAIALGLMGQLYAEQLRNFEVAKEYFQQALAQDMYAVGVYPQYINVLLWNEDYDEAKKLIDFALTLKGTDKGVLYLKKALFFECKKKYKKALQCIQLAMDHTYNNDFMADIKEEKSRIKAKMPKQKKEQKKSTKEEHKNENTDN